MGHLKRQIWVQFTLPDMAQFFSATFGRWDINSYKAIGRVYCAWLTAWRTLGAISAYSTFSNSFTAVAVLVRPNNRNNACKYRSRKSIHFNRSAQNASLSSFYDRHAMCVSLVQTNGYRLIASPRYNHHKEMTEVSFISSYDSRFALNHLWYGH